MVQRWRGRGRWWKVPLDVGNNRHETVADRRAVMHHVALCKLLPVPREDLLAAHYMQGMPVSAAPVVKRIYGLWMV